MFVDILNEAKDEIIKTGAGRKLTLGGKTETFPVYRIPLKYLYYNDQNDRIATWIIKYKTENDIEALDPSSEGYNDIIEGFIIDSNSEAFEKTKENIRKFDQREPGVIMPDGRIIDGNRRFTCLRKLAESEGRFDWFETIVIPKEFENNAKQIKLLELSIQHGEETKVGYNPIDRLVGVYNDIEANKLLTINEYAQSTNTTTGDVKKMLEQARLMVEFLEFINADGRYYIARELKLDGPLVELNGILKSCTSDQERQDFKNATFTMLALGLEGDKSRVVRKQKEIVRDVDTKTEYLDAVRPIIERFVEKVEDLTAGQGKIDMDVIRDDLRTDAGLKRSFTVTLERHVDKVENKKQHNLPEMLVDKAIGILIDIDQAVIPRLTLSERQSLYMKCDELKARISEIVEAIDNA